MGCRKLSYGSEADIPIFRDRIEGQCLEKSSIFLRDTHVKKGQPLKNCYNYYTFGLTFNHGGTGDNLYKYNGKEEQGETGLYDYIARQYDPELGRFTSIDPLADMMRRYSPYAYAFDNPIRFVDHDGMAPDDQVEDKDKKKDAADYDGGSLTPDKLIIPEYDPLAPAQVPNDPTPPPAPPEIPNNSKSDEKDEKSEEKNSDKSSREKLDG